MGSVSGRWRRAISFSFFLFLFLSANPPPSPFACFRHLKGVKVCLKGHTDALKERSAPESPLLPVACVYDVA